MSQGINASLSQLRSMVEGITPKTDPHHGFVGIETGDGQTASLSDRYLQTRLFMFEVIGFATDDGQAGLSGRKRAAINLQVRYDVPQSIGFLQLMMSEDASKLIDTLKGPNYVLGTSGIVSLIPGSPTGAPILDETGDPIAFLLNLPFELLYLEA